MLKSIRVNYEARDFFGQREMRSDGKDDPTEKDVEKAFKNVRRGDFYAHFNYADGTSDCVYADYSDLQDGTWTLIHSESWNSRDDPVRLSPREVRKRVRDAIAR